MKITASKLRQNIYRLLDQVANTGIPMDIDRKGIMLKIIKTETVNKLDNLKKRKTLNCDPDDIVHMDWSSEWKWKE